MPKLDQGKQLLIRTVAMLTHLCRARDLELPDRD